MSEAVRCGLYRNGWWKLIGCIYGARIDDVAEWVSVWREIFESGFRDLYILFGGSFFWGMGV